MAKYDDEDLRLFYQIVIDDIRYSKQQQWHSIYLTLLAIVATVSLFLRIQPNPSFSQTLRGLLIVVCIGVSLLGIIFIGIYHSSIAKYRCKKENILKKLPKEIKALDCDCQIWKHYKKDLFSFTLPFWILIAFSAFLAIWVICSVR